MSCFYHAAASEVQPLVSETGQAYTYSRHGPPIRGLLARSALVSGRAFSLISPGPALASPPALPLPCDYAQVRAGGNIDQPTAKAALAMLEVDPHGFDEIDRKLLLTIIEKYQGGPVGVNTLAAALAEESDAIEEIYEPFLIQIGFLNRTPRGRVATQLAYEHFGITPNRRQSSLF